MSLNIGRNALRYLKNPNYYKNNRNISAQAHIKMASLHFIKAEQARKVSPGFLPPPIKKDVLDFATGDLLFTEASRQATRSWADKLKAAKKARTIALPLLPRPFVTPLTISVALIKPAHIPESGPNLGPPDGYLHPEKITPASTGLSPAVFILFGAMVLRDLRQEDDWPKDEEGGNRLRTLIKNYLPRDTGELINSVQVNIYRNFEQVKIEVHAVDHSQYFQDILLQALSTWAMSEPSYIQIEEYKLFPADSSAIEII